MDQAEKLRLMALANIQEWCDIANEATAAGLIIVNNIYVAPDGKWRAIGPTISQLIPTPVGNASQ